MSKDKIFNEKRLYGKEDRGTIQFYQLSKELINHEKYRELSFGAKVLYAILFDRLQLSIENNWRDDQGHFYVQFKVKPAQGDLRPFNEKPQSERSLTEVLNANAKTVGKYKKELKEMALLFEVKEGPGKVSRMYLAKLFSAEKKPLEPKEDSAPGDEITSQPKENFPSEGEMPPQTTPKLPLRGDIITPQRYPKFPPNDTDLNKTYFSDTDFSEINQSKENISQEKRTESAAKNEKNEKDKKSDGIDRRNLQRINPLLNEAKEQPSAKQIERYKSPEEVHNILVAQYGKELLQEGIAIIQTKQVSKYGYEKYLTKILEDLASRRKSQALFEPAHIKRAASDYKSSYHLKESRYKSLTEEEINARLKAKNRQGDRDLV